MDLNPRDIADAKVATTTLTGPGGIRITAKLRATGHKSSEGDGRTAADIRRELAAKRQEDR